MTLRAAVQMDPMDDINIGGDSSFHLILKALERGYELYHYDVRGLTWEAGRLTTKAHRIDEAQRAAGAHYQFGDEKSGTGSGRERVCQVVEISVVAVSVKQ